MTLAHSASLFFGGSTEAAKKRTQRLKAAGYVHERPRFRAYDPSILSLTRRGFEALRRAALLSDYPNIGWESMERRTHVSPFTLQHELDVLTAKAAIVARLRSVSTHRVIEFSTWPRLFSFRARQQINSGVTRSVVMKPDGFIRIAVDHEQRTDAKELAFFLELDRSTETQGNLRYRATGYRDFYRSGGFARWRGHSPESFRQFPFRVLWVFRNAERRNNVTESFLQHNPPILTHSLLTTIDELKADPLGMIWVQPIDYRSALAGADFASPKSERMTYRRQPDRDKLVDECVERVNFIAPSGNSALHDSRPECA